MSRVCALLALLSAMIGTRAEGLEFPLRLLWAVEFENERLPTSAEALVAKGEVSVASVFGRRFFLEAASGEFLRTEEAATVEKFARFENRLFEFTEDLRVRCLEAGTSNVIWTSERMFGQTTGYFPPMVVKAGKKTFVVARTNPVLNMAQQIANDRNFLAKQAGFEANDWRKVDAWIKSPAAAGTAEEIAREQTAIVGYLETYRWAQTFYVFDAETGKRAFTPPILWVGGCQGAGAPPATTRDGRAVVLYRSAYGNWNHGVAPLVALGLLDFETGRIELLRHNQGAQPPWNTFWGTADEAQNFTVAGDDVLIAHQGTLSRFNLKTRDLEKIWGERDTFGGLRAPPWTRNEWHGPSRGAATVADGRVYWVTGSRLLCLGPGKLAEKVGVKTIRPPAFKVKQRAKVGVEDLERAVDEAISTQWAPLYVEPGLAGREYFFEESPEIFVSLAWAFPHLKDGLKQRVAARLAEEWRERAPFAAKAFYPLNEGERRERFEVPPQALTRLGNDKPAHPFGGVYAAWLYAERCEEWTNVLARWPEIEASFLDFREKRPNFGAEPELYFNRYLASLMALEKIAERAGKTMDTREMAARAQERLAKWWSEADTTLLTFSGSAQLDPFIGKGDRLSLAIFPHRHKIALFHELTPEIAAMIPGESVDRAWKTFETLCPTWHVVGGERQYHFGENFIDPPDLNLGAFHAAAFLRKANLATLVGKPFCRGDLYFAQKLAIAMEK